MVYDELGKSILVYGGLIAAGRLNDLWRFNLTTGLWAWLSGFDVADRNGRYSKMGTADSIAVPGARRSFGMDIDIDRRKLYVFGGEGKTFSALTGMCFQCLKTCFHVLTGRLNDLWEYNLQTNLWTWVAGSDCLNQLGQRGPLQVSSPFTSPAGTSGHSLHFNPTSNSLTLVFGTISTTTNDVYRFDIAFGCPAGYQPKLSMTLCEPCPSGTYKRLDGNQSCQKCPQNAICFPGSVHFSCEPGYQPLSSAIVDSCIACPQNSYKLGAGNYQCRYGDWEVDKSCPPGKAPCFQVAGSQVEYKWTWLGGSYRNNTREKYGIKGGFSPEYWPPTRNAHGMAVVKEIIYIYGGNSVESEDGGVSLASGKFCYSPTIF